ncbi:MAG: hypothetical protein Q9226_002243 [Calogaya cf. arnoldii]
MADASSDLDFTQHRHRPAWPAANSTFFEDLAIQAEKGATPQAKARADRLIDRELAKCGGLDNQEYDDIGIMNHIAASQLPHNRNRPRKQFALLQALYYRARQQFIVGTVFYLVLRGLPNPKPLEAPVQLSGSTASVTVVSLLLASFTDPYKETEMYGDEHTPYKLWGPQVFTAPLLWLAVMIVRGCTGDPAEILRRVTDLVEETQWLGLLDEEGYDYWRSYYDHHRDDFVPNPDEQKPESGGGSRPFGFWLPSNIPAHDWTKTILEHVHRECTSIFDDIESVYKKYCYSPVEVFPPKTNEDWHFVDVEPIRLPRHPTQSVSPNKSLTSP